MSENPREIVLDTLLEMERNKIYSHKLIKNVLDKYDYLPIQEKKFVKRVVEGSIERKIELDYIIQQYSSITINKMKPLIRCLLRMSVYQMLYMDSIPESAACNEAVKLAGKRKFTNLKGFVNGVLRKIAKEKESIQFPKKEENVIQYLSIKYSMPEWIISMWLEEYDVDKVQRILEGMSKIQPISIRFSSLISEEEMNQILEKWIAKGVIYEKSSYLPRAYYLKKVEGVASLDGYEEGYFTVQDISSMLCVEEANIRKEDFVMDICSAPGGKTLLAAEKASNVLARDVSEHKTELIIENVNRMKLSDKVQVEVWDGTILDEEKIEKADILFMDVPCSGLGVMGKKRDIKYNVSLEGLESLGKLQKSIIDHSWQYVKKGGILMYSTCTIHKEENEMMKDYICKNYSFEFIMDRQILPGYMDADGFYYAKFRRV